LLTVLVETANSAAKISLDLPAKKRRTITRREFGQVRALACNFIRCPPWDWWLQHQPASKEARMNNDLRNYN
jgi:hypothetical protein